MGIRHLTVMVVAVVVAACGPTEQEKQASARAQLESKIAQKVKSSLKDPDSAKISVNQIFPLFDGQVACGLVNAKNSFGGYVGDHAFEVGVNPDGSVGDPSIASDDRESAVILAMCDFQRQYGRTPGHAGKKATAEQAKQLTDAYRKRVYEVLSKLPPP